MPIRVLIVEDSGFFRRRLEEIVNSDPEMEVCGVAVNGQEAVTQVEKLKPDVVTMDVEMPVMDGITAVREIMAKRPTAILMFSSLTFEGAQSTIDALEAGALDFLPKRFEDVATSKEEGKQLLLDRVRALGRRAVPLSNHRPSGREIAAQRREAEKHTPPPTAVKKSATLAGIDLIAVGASTGGPVALQRILTKLPKSLPVPMIVVQHMPGSFTSAFAQRLNDLCAVEVAEAKEGDELIAGKVLLAPGGRQLGFTRSGGKVRVHLFDEGPEQVYKPCVDTAFKQLADASPGRVLAMILTGMGADGRDGCRIIKQSGGTIWAQDEATSVIFGMPGAIVKAGLADRVLGLDSIAEEIMK